MVQFTKLRINGFKSFVDRTELEIASGLNGVVGPNGCGKSNLVEAMRWVMGENSAKRMRGDGMEDVIFNGTSKRTQRNIAEVSLLLDNSEHKAPAAYNNSDEIEIIRRIERDRGSNYKINGKNVRMRDVQMFFADTITGANSPALVSQGRITQIINAKPLNRRLILEESAGISGLYARRHEAELRLKAADTNIVRIEDILGSMEGRLGALKRQARQAMRYRNINSQIRQFEILLAFMEWKELNEQTQTTQKKFDISESTVADKLIVVTQLTKTQNTQTEDLSPLRQKEIEASAVLQTKRLALQRIEDETDRIEQLLQETKNQFAQINTDKNHEQQSLKESTEELKRIESEQEIIFKEQNDTKDNLAEKEISRNALEKQVIKLEERYTTLMQSEAESKAHKQSLEQQIQTNNERLKIITVRKEKISEELNSLEDQNENTKEIDELNIDIKNLEENSKKLNEDIEYTESNKNKCEIEINDARVIVSKIESKKSSFDTEVTMLETFFENESNEQFSSVLDSVTTDSGFEKALSRALGDALLASLDDNAPTCWITRKSIKDMPALPEGIKSLLPYVKAPKELNFALSQIGIVNDDNHGNNAVETLLTGQSLVSLKGTYWRWDGYCVKAEASDRNAFHLKQKNKLKELGYKAPEITKDVENAKNTLEKSMLKQDAINTKLKKLQEESKNSEHHLTIKRDLKATLHEKQARFESEMIRLKETALITNEDIKTLKEIILLDQDRLKAYELETSEQKSEDIELVYKSLQKAREVYQAAIRSVDIYQQQQNSRKARIHAITDEKINLQNRSIRSREHLKQLEERINSFSQKLEILENQPQNFKIDKEMLLDEISNFEKERNEASEKLAILENKLIETTRTLKESESILGETREIRAAAQATLIALRKQNEDMETQIKEQFKMLPSELLEHAAIDMDKNLGDLESLKLKKEKLIRERENIGAVNLRADEEAQELEKEVTTLIHERNDLIQAIEELRKGINTINKEARTRLIAAFEHVNAHFQQLFIRLFGGGNAHLALIDSDDPLGAGLEIFAQPPGKSLQSLSLLSGGEQAMTSIALIFAMFLTNPSPICVLDEIDAPLDDANVDRVCDLLEEISERGETRFIVITHHRITMARMDRLYGVTMSEKGISQLVSVDLQQSFNFLEAA